MRWMGLAALLSLTACSPSTHRLRTALTRPKYLAVEPDATWTSRACVDTSPLAAHAQLDAAVGDLFAQAGLPLPSVTADSGCEWMVRLTPDAPSLTVEAALVWQAGGLTEPDGFAASTVRTPNGAVLTTISAANERAAAFGLRSVLQFFVDRYDAGSQSVLLGDLVDYPGFSHRGIIEGFYGPTFASDQRAELIALAGYLRQNTYIYALKDADPFTHTRWADAYDDTWAPVISKAVAAAKRSFVDFVWAASPGWYGGPEFQSHSIHYGSDDDFARLVRKTENLRSLGVERFALFVDDVAPDFAWPDDAARFDSLAAAHAYLMNRWDDYLTATGAPHLWVVGSKYTSDPSNSLSGAGWQDYNRTLAAALHPGIQMFWTGPQVYSEQITSGDLAPVEDVVQRQVLVWDNWPKTLEALSGRAADLDRHAAGLLSNFVMDGDDQTPSAALHDFEQTLGTIADYAWQPETYDPAWSFARWTPLLDPLLDRMPTR